ncbi:hypothetical protein PAHAL_5G149800 [Panicum hallii]|jgi:hypothetical protein|uniref:Uncharacterized protein n=1 Tax=Panicum hallii TaxID=206008 RepID=A0A2T8IK22_9POAL|nr:hypothetical protein PAHAL_5G149800 [Panicum hallii]
MCIPVDLGIQISYPSFPASHPKKKTTATANDLFSYALPCSTAQQSNFLGVESLQQGDEG